jgi:hypothetical protein
MPLSRRYTPEKPSAEVCNFGMDYSFVIPPGVGISEGTLEIFTNTIEPADASADWVIGEVQIQDRTLYATLGGGVDGQDYQLRWTATDTLGNVWPRTGLILIAETS